MDWFKKKSTHVLVIGDGKPPFELDFPAYTAGALQLTVRTKDIGAGGPEDGGKVAEEDLARIKGLE